LWSEEGSQFVSGFPLQEFVNFIVTVFERVKNAHFAWQEFQLISLYREILSLE
jgi:hypothetical protein